MRRLATALALYVGLIWCAYAQVGMGGMFPGPGTVHSTGSGYTGPGDVFAFNFWVGLRAYNSATRGTKAINLCDNAGANCADVNTDATTGALSAPGTRGAVNCTTTATCLIHTIYEKASGSALDCVQATAANMPVLNYGTGGPGGNTPAAVFTRSSSQTMTCGVSTGIAQTQPFTEYVVAERTGTTGSFNTVLSDGVDVLFNSSANSCGVYAGAVLADSTHCADSAWHAISGLFNGGSSNAYVDGNTNSGNAGGSTATSNFVLGTGIGGLLDGRMVEAGIANGDQSASFTGLNSNIHTFWGF